MEQLNSLTEAIKIMRNARVELAGGSWTVWNKVDNAIRHIDKQIAALLADN